MTPRQAAFAILATLAALVWAAWDRIEYEWETVPEVWKIVWVAGGLAVSTCLSIWAFYPLMKHLM